MRLRALALAGCWLWLASAASAGELRADWPLGATDGSGALRVEWDGNGVLTLVPSRRYQGQPTRVMRAGPGVSWLLSPTRFDSGLPLGWRLVQTVGRHVVAETPLPTPPQIGSCLLWLGEPKLSADDRARLAGRWADSERYRAIAVGRPADLLPDSASLLRSSLLRSLRLIVVDSPLAAPQKQVVTDYAFAGGLVVLRAGAATLVAKDAPATTMPGLPKLATSPLGLGAVVTVNGAVTADSALWSRIAAADLRAGSPGTASQLPDGSDLARAMDATKPIQSRYLLAFLLAYLAAIGPVTWLVARAGRGSAARGWLAAPVMAALAVSVAAAWVNAKGRKHSAAYQVTSTSLDAGSRYGLARTTLRVATSGAARYTLTPTDRRTRFNYLVLASLDDHGRMRWGPWSIPPRSARDLAASAVIDVGGTVSMDLRQVDGSLRGTIRNAMPFPLRGAVLHWQGRIHQLGTIAPGGLLDLAGREPWSDAPDQARVLAAMGSGDVPTNVRDAATRLVKPASDSTPPPPYPVSAPARPDTGAKLLAWVDAPWTPIEVSPKVGSLQRAQVLQVVSPVAQTSDGERRYTLEAGYARRVDGQPGPATIAAYTCHGQLPKAVSRLAIHGTTGNLALWNHRRAAWQRLSSGGSASLPAADYLCGGRVLLRDDRVDSQNGPDPETDSYARVTKPPKDVTITAIVEDRHGQR